jgi:PAS domain S-box-containing protein
VLPHDEQFHGFDVEHVFESVGRKVMKLNGRRLDHVQLILLAIEDVTEERDLFARLRESEERARVLVETLTIGSWEADPSGEMALDAKSWCALTGRSEEELRGDGWLDVVHPDDRERIVRRWKAAVAKGEVSDDEFRILDATGRYRWTYTHAAPLLDEAGRVRKWAGMIIDISARKAAEEERELLLGELEHRVKNLFAVIRALANQQGQGETRDAAADRRVFLERLDALMRSHDLALAGDWQSVDLTRLARDAVEPYRPDDGERLVIDGAPVRIAPRTAQSLSFVLNELATNAIKYGALSVPEGRVELRWWVETSDGERRVRLRWTERGGPPVEPPERPSFGTRLIRRAFASEPGGGAELDFAADGVRFDASFPAL